MHHFGKVKFGINAFTASALLNTEDKMESHSKSCGYQVLLSDFTSKYKADGRGSLPKTYSGVTKEQMGSWARTQFQHGVILVKSPK